MDIPHAEMALNDKLRGNTSFLERSHKCTQHFLCYLATGQRKTRDGCGRPFSFSRSSHNDTLKQKRFTTFNLPVYINSRATALMP